MESRGARPRPSGWALGAALAATAGGAVETVTAGMAGLPLGIGTGALGLVGAFVVLRAPLAGALLLALSGTGGIVLDLLGAGPPPRVLPGALLLLGAAFAGGGAVSPGTTTPVGRAFVAAGVVVHAALGVPLSAIGLAVPGGALLGLLPGWAAVLAVALRFREERPWLVAAAPFAVAVLTALVVTVGSAALGWTA